MTRATPRTVRTALLAAALLALLGAPSLASAQASTELEALRAENAKLTEQLKDAREQIKTLQAQVQELTNQAAEADQAKDIQAQLRSVAMEQMTQVAELEQQLEELQFAYDQLRADNMSLREENVELDSQTKELTAETKTLKAETEKLEQVAGLTAEGELVRAVDGLISHEYDADADQTVIWSRPEKLTVIRGSSAAYAASLRMIYPGQQQTGQPASITLRVITGDTVGSLEEPETFTVELADQTLSLPVTQADIDRRRTVTARTKITRSSMQADAAVTLEQLSAIAEHSEATLTVSRADLTLTPQDIAVFRAMLKRAEALK